MEVSLPASMLRVLASKSVLMPKHVIAPKGGVCFSGLLGKPHCDKVDARVPKCSCAVALGKIMT